MKIQYEEWNPHQKSLHLIEYANQVIEEYRSMGFVLTLRQLYYQFVARDIIENTERSYNNLVNLITKARMAGFVSWEAIEDRNRTLNWYNFEESHERLVKNLEYRLNLDLWKRQPKYVEVWVEKEALGNVVEQACQKRWVPHLACKGYLSASVAWRAGRRFKQRIEQGGQECHLIHLGDHDPSGIDMTRDNQERVDLFSSLPGEVTVHRLALNLDQVEEYNPPPNPAKKTDSRWKEYNRRFGGKSWELDALKLQVIEKLICTKVDSLIDMELWEKNEAEEQDKKDVFRKLSKKWPKIYKKLTKKKGKKDE